MPGINPDKLPPNSSLKRAIDAANEREKQRAQSSWGKSNLPSSIPAKETATTAKPRKYRNQPIEVDGEKFDSILEYKAWIFLCLYFRFHNVIRQVSIPLGSIEGTGKTGKKSTRQRRIQLDFMVINAGKTGVLFFDAKGFKTKDWAVKADWLKQKHGVTVHILDDSNVNVDKLPGGGYTAGQPSDEFLKEIFGDEE